jgi:hypothetical protein
MKIFIFKLLQNGYETELTITAHNENSAQKKYNAYLWDRNIDACDIISITEKGAKC